MGKSAVKSNAWRVLEPCYNCPLMDDGKSMHLDEERVNEIKRDLLNDGNFVCHKTAHGLDEEGNPTDEPQTMKMCAGAYLFLKKMGQPNEIMRVARIYGL